MTLKQNAPSGGSISLTVTDTVAAHTLTLPATTGTVATSEALAAVSAALLASSGASLVGHQGAATGSQAVTLADVAEEVVNLFRFIPKSQHAAIKNFTSVTDCTPYIAAAFAASNGRKIRVSAGKYNHTDLTYAKTLRFHLEGEFAGYDAALGAVFNYTGTGIGLQIGVDDGNPDSTGPIRNVVVTGVAFSTTTGATAIRAQNTALCRIEKNSMLGYSGKIIDCRANVVLKIRDNDIRGSQPVSGNYGVWLDEEYFGSFVTEIVGNHIYQVNWAARFCEGRSLTVTNNVIENLRGWTVANPERGGCFVFETSGYLSNATFADNYSENAHGWMFYGASFTGAILNLVVNRNEFWGSGDPANINPGFGNIPRTKVSAHNVADNLVVDAEWNAKAYLVLPSVFPTTSIFDATTTIVGGQVTNKEYEDAIAYSLKGADMLGYLGDFTTISGGTPGTLSVNGSLQHSVNGAATSPPIGWTASGFILGSVWNAVLDTMTGGWVCHVPGSGGTYDLAQITVTVSAVARTRYFAIGLTSKGWSVVKANGAVVYDSGATVGRYHTEVCKFTIPANATTFTLTLGTNASTSFWAEMRLFEVGSAEYNEPGSMNGAMTKAVKRAMKRGVY